MAPDPTRSRRSSLRLPGYDYTQPGMYFITLCSHGRECIFGEVIDEVTNPSALGRIVIEEWTATASIRPEISLDEWMLMPNHLHAIVTITGRSNIGDSFDWVGCGDSREHPQRQPRSLGALVGGFKSRTTSRINTLRSSPGRPVWQRGFYDHVIRNDRALERIRRYILDNPLRWTVDPDNPVNFGSSTSRRPL